MRKIYYVLVCFFLSFVSCNWLEVPFEDQIAEDELFKDGDGYRRVLLGIYTSISNESMYGREMTWGLLDVAGQVYTLDKSQSLSYKEAQKCNWASSDLEGTISAIWETAYNAIANCNNLIQHVENADSTLFAFGNMEKNMILSEAIALRAMLHFDLLRLFAPAPSTKPQGNWLPYNTEHPQKVPQVLPVDTFLTKVFDDLKTAQAIMAEFDKSAYGDFLAHIRFDLTEGPRGDRFVDHRGYRMNYYSVSALLARAYFYAGGEYADLAYEQAWNLVFYIGNSFDFSKETEIRLGDIKFYGDIFCGLYNDELTDFDKLINGDVEATQYLALADVENIYGNEMEDDFRFINQIEKQEDEQGRFYYRSKKYREIQGNVLSQAQISEVLIPLFRRSEMYYLIAEYVFDKRPDEAQHMLETVKKGRGLLNADLSGITSKDDFMKLLEDDMRREFAGEGQIFFFYKRLNRTIPGFLGEMSSQDFVLPIPKSEKI